MINLKEFFHINSLVHHPSFLFPQFDHQTLQSYTYAELAQLIRKTATAFSEQFLIPGDYILFVGPNCVEYLALYFGAIAIGAIPIHIPQKNISLREYDQHMMIFLKLIFFLFFARGCSYKNYTAQHSNRSDRR